MKRSIRAITEKTFEWLSFAAGLLILGSCTYAGYDKNGVGGGILGFVLAVFSAVALIAFVFMVTRTSADIRAIREHIDPQPPEDGGAP